MADFEVRTFDDEAAIRRVGEGLLACNLPRAEWTHEAHLAACLWLLRERSDIRLEQQLPDIIRSYNESVGGVNDDAQGYHETLTQFYISTVKAHNAEQAELDLLDSVNLLLRSMRGKRDWPLRFYSKDVLFSIRARRELVPPDLLDTPHI
ncbi:MAG TPA: hypothetical protein PKC48_00545 [Sphingorhabdus sp.]|jgi:hypothetical protein|uniref:hypothetical protein n=1 Tax=Sphingorhabdus sp. TaxID=1902408 RepID=UPI002B66B3D6|nr:hypothetical protein [Sphingorhabdus sp.]HMT42038.1 hypothetical protein [Sphingorhabdus sp.]HMU20739.1 hypothetical protein [Sphingorhabdus sp.]